MASEDASGMAKKTESQNSLGTPKSKVVDLSQTHSVKEEEKKLSDLAAAAAGDIEVSMEEEVRQTEMESRLRRLITDVLKPSIVKVTRLQTDHETMCTKFQEMINSHNQVMSAQKEAKEHSEMIGVFKSKLNEFWTFNNQLDDKINNYQKAAVQRMEELEHAVELNKSSIVRLGRNFERALEDTERLSANLKTTQVNFERGIQKNREQMEREVKQIHVMIGEVRDLHHKLEVEVWGPEDCNDISPPSLRKLDMQTKKHGLMLTEAMEDILKLQKLDEELMVVTKRQGISEVQVKELQTTTKDIGQRVEVCAQEAKADFKQASNLMAAFSANLVREARTSFKDELKHAQEMQKDVDNFVRQTQESLVQAHEFGHSMGKQLEALVREVRTDLESCDQKRGRDKRALEEQLRQVQTTVIAAVDSSESMLKGLDHVSGVISMSLQSEKMSVALDLQEFHERKDTPYVGVRESRVETMRLRNAKAASGVRQPGVDVEALHRLVYHPQQVNYQGTNFERQKLLTLRENLVNIAQDVLQQGPDMKKKFGDAAMAPDMLLQAQQPNTGPVARPGSRGQPGARGSPGPESIGKSPDGDDTSSLSSAPQMDAAGPSMAAYLRAQRASSGPNAEVGVDDLSGFGRINAKLGGGDNANHLPALANPAKRKDADLDKIQAPLTAR